MDYTPSLLFRNGHLNSIYPSLFRKQTFPDYQRIELSTPDDDFLDIDHLNNNNNRLAILCHGLEGSSGSNYIIGTGALLSAKGWDIVAVNYRGCSGRINKQLRMYHSGATDDLGIVVDYFLEQYQEIVLIGFSLGGNLVLKYSGEKAGAISPKIKCCTAISVPLDLEAGSRHIGKTSNYIYDKNFLKTLSQKVKAKHQQFPDQIKVEPLKHIKTVYDFDDAYTGPIHGFKDAHHYYSTCSSKNFLKHITIPTLIINALDDPFLPEECYPDRYPLPPNVKTRITKHGGHVGWVQRGHKNYWAEELVGRFVGEVVGE